MLRKMAVLLFAAIILAASTAVWGKEKERLEIGAAAPMFILKDANDKEYSLELLLSKEGVKGAVLMIGDRKVRKDANKWARELHKIYGKNKQVVMLMIADLRDLPFFATEGMVKWGTKREKLPVTILLDWDGKVTQMYKAQKKKPNLFILSRDGKLLHYQIEKYSDENLKKVTSKMQDLLKEKEGA